MSAVMAYISLLTSKRRLTIKQEIMETRFCKVCGQELPLSEFKKTAFAPNGISTCNKCCARKAQEKRENNKLENRVGGGNSELARFTPRELIEELRARGYKGKLYITREIVL